MEGLGAEGRETLGMTAELLGLTQGWSPHAEELNVEPVSDEVVKKSWDQSEEPELFGAGGECYPAA
jgi:hypothetical protein